LRAPEALDTGASWPCGPLHRPAAKRTSGRGSRNRSIPALTPVGSGTRRSAGVRGLVTTRETHAYGASSVCPPGSVRLPLPPDRRNPETRRSQHSPIGHAGAPTYHRRASRTGEFGRPTAPSSRPSSPRLRREISPHWKVSLQRMWCPTRKAAESCVQRTPRSPVESGSRSLLLRSLHISGPVSRSR
jgi:hypothetical protein